MTRQPKIFVLVLILCSFLTVNTAFAQKQLNCKGVFIGPGDHRSKVLRLCGEPDSKEHIGYTASTDGSPLLVIEEWVYGPRNGEAYYWYVKFVGSKVSYVEAEREN